MTRKELLLLVDKKAKSVGLNREISLAAIAVIVELEGAKPKDLEKIILEISFSMQCKFVRIEIAAKRSSTLRKLSEPSFDTEGLHFIANNIGPLLNSSSFSACDIIALNRLSEYLGAMNQRYGTVEIVKLIKKCFSEEIEVFRQYKKENPGDDFVNIKE